MKLRFTYLFLVFLTLLTSCSSTKNTAGKATSSNTIEVAIDLVHIQNDKVQVSVKPTKVSTQTVTFQLPKIIPGTYAIEDYGRYIDDFKALDKAGNTLTVTKQDVNTWVISNAVQLDKVTYLVNDTFDSEKGEAFAEGSTTIFSPAGTNILEGKQFMLNMCGFVGYFENQKNIPYHITINHPADLTGTSSMDDMDNSATTDVYNSPRYADVVDSPIMYATADIASFTVDGMKVVLHVYSPVNKAITAQALLPDLQKMMVAQKNFLGKINTTPKYVVLVYVTATGSEDAKGIGALEHNTSTLGVFMNTMTSTDLINVISHEFFHTLTPLNFHSTEIQDFDFNSPKMSAHLWMYEGFTEYFAQFFQVNQGLISEEKFLEVMSGKYNNAKAMYPKPVSFTEMSKNILAPEMKVLYPNVYQKGALMAMCLDLIIREKSNGKRGILSMMGELSKIYGPNKPFNDDDLISVVTKATYPEVGAFLQKHVVKGEEIDYDQYIKYVGVSIGTVKTPVQIAFVVDKKPYVRIDKEKNQVIVQSLDNQNELLNAMGLQNNDLLLAINDVKVDASDMMSIFGSVFNLQEGKSMVMKVNRNGKIIDLKGITKVNYIDAPGFIISDESKKELRERWLKG
jgi:predicted metalloprotease with PDZ domain